MSKYLNYVFFIPAFAGLTLVVDVMADNSALTASQDGLQLVEKDRYSNFYARPDIDWNVYTQVQLKDTPVAFRTDWQRNQNRSNPFKVDDKDMETIANSLSGQVRVFLTEALSKNGGYAVNQASGPHVLVIKPAIVDLDVAAPDTLKGAFSRQYTDSSTRMTLKLEFYDSVTGELLATSSDRLEDPRRGYLEWTTSGSNRADSERLLRQWAAGLRQKLEEARGKEPEANHSS